MQERISAYLHSLSCGQGAYLDSVRQKAEAGGVPIIRIEMESFLASFLELVKPAAILEAGTAVGYSSMLMAKLTELCVLWGSVMETVGVAFAKVVKTIAMLSASLPF